MVKTCCSLIPYLIAKKNSPLGQISIMNDWRFKLQITIIYDLKLTWAHFPIVRPKLVKSHCFCSHIKSDTYGFRSGIYQYWSNCEKKDYIANSNFKQNIWTSRSWTNKSDISWQQNKLQQSSGLPWEDSQQSWECETQPLAWQ